MEGSRWEEEGHQETQRKGETDRETEAGRQRQRERVARVRNPEERVRRERGGGVGGRDDGLGGGQGG